MKLVLITFLSLQFILFSSCNGKTSTKQTNHPYLFSDTPTKNGVALFSLLDNYPSLKNGMKKLDPIEFNKKMDESMQRNRSDLPGGLRALESMLLNNNSQIRPALQKLASILNKIQNNNPTAFNTALPYLERIRFSKEDFVPAVLPVDYKILNYIYLDPNYIKDEYEAKLKETGKTSLTETEIKSLREEKIKNKILSLATNLQKQENIDIVKKLEDLMQKAIVQNPQMKYGLTKLLEGVFDETSIADRTLKNKVVQLIESLGNMMNAKAGLGTRTKTPETVFKEIVINLEKYYTAGGTEFDKDPGYNEKDHSTEFATILTDTFKQVRKLINPPSNLLKDPAIPLLSLITQNYYNLSFTKSVEDIDNTITQLIEIDLAGKKRISDTTSDQVSALESLMFLLSLSDVYGYYWNNDKANPQITSMSNGIITMGDATHSLSSKLATAGGEDSIANLGLVAVLNTNYVRAQSGYVTRDGVNYPLNLNTPALSLLEGESRGSISSASDAVYTKTIPFVLNLISSSIYSGKAPYYNKNRKDTKGNILNIDGSIYRNSNGTDVTYKSSWKTASYKVNVKNGDSAGLDGTKANSLTNGTSFTIKEIDIPESQRAVETDEEAFYKNFQWLLYQKRMVIVIPVYVEALNQELRDAVFATVVANGFKGLMNVKPYCTDACKESDSGIWLKAQKRVKSTFKTAGDLDYFSDIAGDSAFLIEVWGYGISGTTYSFTDDTTYQQVFRLLFSKFNEPSRFYGPIPAPIKWNFDVIERLGFVTSTEITPDKVVESWNYRNKLLPLVVALAKSFSDQADTVNGKNPFSLLTDLAKVLTRPYINSINDPVTSTATNGANLIPITSLKIRGANSQFGIRSPSMPSADLYFADLELRGFLSVLIENQRRYQDGLFSLVGRSTTLTALGGLIYELGMPTREKMRNNFVEGLKNVLSQIKVESESPEANQFNIEASIKSLRDDLAAYPDTRPKDNLSDSSWSRFDDVIGLVKDFVSTSSPYTYTDNISKIMEVLIDAKPTYNELSSLLDILGALLTKENSTTEKSYLLTDVLTKDVPSLLPDLAPGGRNLVGILEGISAPGTFLPYFYTGVRSDYPIKDILRDLEKFANSYEVQTTEKNPSSLFYTLGTLVGQFAGVIERGKKFSPSGGWFEDSNNTNERDTTFFDSLNYIFTKK